MVTFAQLLPSEESKDTPPQQDLPNGVNDNLYDEEGYAFYEHEIGAEYEDDPDVVMCYTCHFSRTHAHEQGMKNCDEPFNETGIPTILCRGSCAKTKTWMRSGKKKRISKKKKKSEEDSGKTDVAVSADTYDDYAEEYMIIRSCLPNCKNIEDPDSSVECCTGTKCNGARPDVYVVASSLGAIGVVFTLGLFYAVCYKWAQ